MHENKNILSSQERQVTIIGPEAEPLYAKWAQSDALQDEISVQTRTDYLRRGPVSTLTEREVVIDYFNFLQKVQDVSSTDNSVEATRISTDANRFMRETTFLSTHERREALVGILGHHVEFLRENPANHVSVFVEPNDTEHSRGLLATEAKNLIDTYAPDIAPRFQLAPALQEASEKGNVRNVLLDDWSVTGNQLSNAVGRALRSTGDASMQKLSQPNLEIDLLVVRDDQVADNFTSTLARVEEEYQLDNPIPVVGFYRAPVAKQLEGPMPSGAHSSVDYGFEHPLQNMRNYVAKRTGEDLNLPYLASIQRPHRDW